MCWSSTRPSRRSRRSAQAPGVLRWRRATVARSKIHPPWREGTDTLPTTPSRGPWEVLYGGKPAGHMAHTGESGLERVLEACNLIRKTSGGFEPGVAVSEFQGYLFQQQGGGGGSLRVCDSFAHESWKRGGCRAGPPPAGRASQFVPRPLPFIHSTPGFEPLKASSGGHCLEILRE
jgi:hypothetical protein